MSVLHTHTHTQYVVNLDQNAASVALNYLIIKDYDVNLFHICHWKTFALLDLDLLS